MTYTTNNPKAASVGHGGGELGGGDGAHTGEENGVVNVQEVCDRGADFLTGGHFGAAFGGVEGALMKLYSRIGTLERQQGYVTKVQSSVIRC